MAVLFYQLIKLTNEDIMEILGYEQILEKLKALKGEINRVKEIKEPEVALAEFDKIDDFYKEQKALLKDMTLVLSFSDEVKAEIQAVIDDIGYEIAMLDDEFESRGWEN